MYHVSAQGVDERMINVHYYYSVRHLSSLSSFKPELETHLFSSIYWSVYLSSHSANPSAVMHVFVACAYVRACVCVMKWAYPYIFVIAPASYEIRCLKESSIITSLVSRAMHSGLLYSQLLPRPCHTRASQRKVFVTRQLCHAAHTVGVLCFIYSCCN